MRILKYQPVGIPRVALTLQQCKMFLTMNGSPASLRPNDFHEPAGAEFLIGA